MMMGIDRLQWSHVKSIALHFWRFVYGLRAVSHSLHDLLVGILQGSVEPEANKLVIGTIGQEI